LKILASARWAQLALAELIVSFREFFEIFLLLGVMLAFLRKAGQRRFEKFVFTGAAGAGIASVLLAGVFPVLKNILGFSEQLFDGVVLLLAAVFVTWLILWMFRHANASKALKKKLSHKVELEEELGVAGVAFFAVLREGAEIVLFLEGIAASSGAINYLFVFAGFLTALGLTHLFFRKMIELNLQKFFFWTSVLLVLLAAGLVSQGINELQEAWAVSPIVEKIWDLKLVHPIFNEQVFPASLLKSTFGYYSTPSLAQLITYFTYLAVASFTYSRIVGKQRNSSFV